MIRKRLRMFTKQMNEQEADEHLLKVRSFNQAWNSGKKYYIQKVNVFDKTDDVKMDEVMKKIRTEQNKPTVRDMLYNAPMELIRGGSCITSHFPSFKLFSNFFFLQL